MKVTKSLTREEKIIASALSLSLSRCSNLLSVSLLPVTPGVVQRAAGPHGLKVVHAPAHERDGSPEDGQHPDDGAHHDGRAPEELLSWVVTKWDKNGRRCQGNYKSMSG